MDPLETAFTDSLWQIKHFQDKGPVTVVVFEIAKMLSYTSKIERGVEYTLGNCIRRRPPGDKTYSKFRKCLSLLCFRNFKNSFLHQKNGKRGQMHSLGTTIADSSGRYNLIKSLGIIYYKS